MAKFKVGDKVIALRDSIDNTEGNDYEVTHTYGKEIRIIDDVGDGHVVEAHMFAPYEEEKGDDIMTKSNAGTLEVIVEDTPTTQEVHAGQVRMDEDGAVILVIEAIEGLDYADEDGRYNTVILHCPYGGLGYEVNMPHRNQHASDIEKEFPTVVNAKLHVSSNN